MTQNTTLPGEMSVETYLGAIELPGRRKDADALIALMRELTGDEPEVWGGRIVGFGRYPYRYATGREGEWFRTGLSSGKRETSIYVMSGFEEHLDLLEPLGRHRIGKVRLYVRALSEVDMSVLRELNARSVQAPMGEAIERS